jgi:hypothetical protein
LGFEVQLELSSLRAEGPEPECYPELELQLELGLGLGVELLLGM